MNDYLVIMTRSDNSFVKYDFSSSHKARQMISIAIRVYDDFEKASVIDSNGTCTLTVEQLI
jgi:hypothetical protein